jgi:hypothetical protein
MEAENHTMHLASKLLSILLIASFTAMPILMAEATPTLTLDMRRDFGSAMGNDIAGKFTLKADASGDTSYVEFYLVNQLQLNDTSAPYSWQFNTNNYTIGQHTLKAVAYDNAGQSQNSELTRNFVEDNTNTILIAGIGIAVIVSAIAVTISVYRIRKTKK